MPKQHTLFGRPVRLPPRRISCLLVGLAVFAVFTLIFSVPSSMPTGPSLSKFTDHKFSMPSWSNPWSSRLNPFRTPSHPPPRQTNDTNGEVSWYSHWRWLMEPFSSSVTLDDTRLLLPPYPSRAPIYCYYDTTVARDRETKDAESSLLLTWRRAWWAKGFRPIILSAAEAMNNPSYEELQRMPLSQKNKELYDDIMRWLAFENMGGGLLAHHLVFPMARYDDPLLVHLRHAEYPKLTRWEGFGNGLFSGSKDDVTKALRLAFDNAELEKSTSLVRAVPIETFAVDPTHSGLAFYDDKALALYSSIAEETGASRLTKLNNLVNAHLHVAWQNGFLDGSIAVLKPFPLHTSEIIAPALQLAQWLQMCPPENPIPGSCPPNMPNCRPCSPENKLKITTPSRYSNQSNIYTIATVPHPLTLALLDTMTTEITIPDIRRKMDHRDPWLSEAFAKVMGTGVSGFARVLKFKEAVAAEYTSGRSLFLEAEKGEPDSKSTASLALALKEQIDIDWYFGFMLPRNSTDPALLKLSEDESNGKSPSTEERVREPELLKRAREVGRSRSEEHVRIRSAIEAWHLADAEAWRFAQAYRGREEMERRKWDEEEAKYAGGAGNDKRKGWGDRWE